MDLPVSYCYPELSLSRRTHVRRGIFYSNNNNNNVRWKNRRSTSLIPPTSPCHSVRVFIRSVHFRSVAWRHARTREYRHLVTRIVAILENKERYSSSVVYDWFGKQSDKEKRNTRWSRTRHNRETKHFRRVDN